jgi:DNA polymerase V
MNYLAAVLGLHTRRVVGWTFSAKPDAELVIKAPLMPVRGTPCLELEEAAPAKQEICCSRMLGKRLRELPPDSRGSGQLRGTGLRETACSG